MSDKRMIVAALAMVAIFAALAPSASCHSSQSGITDLTNATVTYSAGVLAIVEDLLADNTTDFVGLEGYEFIWVHDNGLVLNETIGSATYTLAPTVPLTRWYVLIDDANNQAILRTATDIPTAVFSLVSFWDFYEAVFGVVAYGIILVVPVSMYLYTKSTGLFIILCVLLGGGGAVTLPAAWMPFAILPIGLGLGVLLYKVFWPGRDDDT